MNNNQTWYNKIGFSYNPLSIKPTENINLIGYEKIIQRIVYQIKIGNVIFLEGTFGTGKSSILRAIRKDIQHNILYFNCAQQTNLKKAIMAKRSFFRKIFFLKPVKMTLLVDEAHLANPKEFDFLYEFYIMDRIKSIVFAGTEFKGVPFNKAFKSDTKIYRLNEIRNNLAVEIIRSRIPEIEIIPPALAKKVFALSENNPRRFLENIEDLMRNASSCGKDKISSKDVEDFFGKQAVVRRTSRQRAMPDDKSFNIGF